MSITQNLQGHTPHDRLSCLINRLCDELQPSKAACTVSADVLALAEQAKAVIDGYDKYLKRMSSPVPPMLDTMITESNETDWDAVHLEGKTMFRLIPEMTAGGYEATVLQQLVKISKVVVHARPRV